MNIANFFTSFLKVFGVSLFLVMALVSLNVVIYACLESFLPVAGEGSEESTATVVAMNADS